MQTSKHFKAIKILLTEKLRNRRKEWDPIIAMVVLGCPINMVSIWLLPDLWTRWIPPADPTIPPFIPWAAPLFLVGWTIALLGWLIGSWIAKTVAGSYYSFKSSYDDTLRRLNEAEMVAGQMSLVEPPPPEPAPIVKSDEELMIENTVLNSYVSVEQGTRLLAEARQRASGQWSSTTTTVSSSEGGNSAFLKMVAETNKVVGDAEAAQKLAEVQRQLAELRTSSIMASNGLNRDGSKIGKPDLSDLKRRLNVK